MQYQSQGIDLFLICNWTFTAPLIGHLSLKSKTSLYLDSCHRQQEDILSKIQIRYFM